MFKPSVRGLLARGLLVLACMSPAFALAQQQTAVIDIPAGSLVSGLDALARQTGVQFVYSTDQLAGLHTRGTHGKSSAQQALADLLAGTGYSARRDASGAVVIVKTPPKPVFTPAHLLKAWSAGDSLAPVPGAGLERLPLRALDNLPIARRL